MANCRTPQITATRARTRSAILSYLYTIREVGGIATGAYVDGRNTAYGKNEYYNSNQGIECYQIEMGYMNSDLQKVIEEEEDIAYAISEAIAEVWR